MDAVSQAWHCYPTTYTEASLDTMRASPQTLDLAALEEKEN